MKKETVMKVSNIKKLLKNFVQGSVREYRQRRMRKYFMS